MVDPAGLKPAPHDLKGRCSVTRAPDQNIADCRFSIADLNARRGDQWLIARSQIGNRQLTIGNDLAVAEGFEPSVIALTVRCLTNLATPQNFLGCGGES